MISGPFNSFNSFAARQTAHHNAASSCLPRTWPNGTEADVERHLPHRRQRPSTRRRRAATATSRTHTSCERGLGRIAAEARGQCSAAVPVRRRRAAVQRGPFSSIRSRAASRTRTHFEPGRAYARPTTSIKAGRPAPCAVDAPSGPCAL